MCTNLDSILKLKTLECTSVLGIGLLCSVSIPLTSFTLHAGHLDHLDPILGTKMQQNWSTDFNRSLKEGTTQQPPAVQLLMMLRGCAACDTGQG